MGIAPAIDLTADQRRTVLGLLNRYLPDTTVWAYGSRVKWASHPASDLDLVAFATPQQGPRIAELREAFEESTLPFVVDLFVWDDVPTDFRKRIVGQHVPLCEGATDSIDGPWPKVSIGNVVRIVGGGTPSTADPLNFDGEIPWLTPKDLSGVHDRHIARGARNLSSLGLERSSARPVPAGSVLLSTRAPIGYVCVAKNQITTNQGFRSLIANEQLVPAFLYYWLLSNRQELERHASGSTFKELSAKALASIKMVLPPKTEQERVVAVLGALDDKIELNRRMAETLDALVRSLFGELCDLDHNWPHRSLADIAQLVRGRSYTSKELEHSAETAMVTLKSFERGGGYRPGGLKAFRGPYKVEQAVSPGEVVVACTDVTQAAEVVGRSAIVQQTRRFKTLVASLDVLVLRPAERDVSTAFLYALTRAPRFVAHAKAHATGTTVLHLDRKAVPRFSFRYPPKERLNTFNDIAQPAIERYSKLMCEADCIKEVRDALLPQLLSGRLRVHGAEKLAEAVT